jgi:CheY-like chemotaxis protein
LIRNSADLNAQNLALEHEIADRQRAEEALRASERQLRQTQRMEAIGQLTGGLAHDFNNLLAIIQESVDLLEDQLEPDNRLLATIQRATTRGAELTQRLLAYSRKQTLNTRPFDLARLVAGMSEFLTRTLGATIEIAVDADPNLMSALADPGQVENALLNLTLNARDAMPKGGKLTIECRNAQLDEAYVARNPEAKAGNYVVLAVSDEDDRDVSALVVGVLEGLNYRVIDAADAASAHEVLANGTPVDPVLSDVVLPGGTSGPGFAEQVRKNDPDLKIIFMSGYPAEAAKRAGFLDSGQVLLNKPFQRPQLVTALRAMLD